MNSIAQNISQIQKSIPRDVTLICVSKFHSVEAIQKAYDSGERNFGESRVQELQVKQPQLPCDIQWHFIGHLQTNKIKYIAPYVSLIHSVDSFKLLKAINKEGKKNNRKIACLLQVHIAKEESKFGFSEEELTNILSSDEMKELHHIEIKGLMGMATFTDNQQQVASEFTQLAQLYSTIKKRFFSQQPSFKELSMGMSNDYLLAIEKGSTMIRIGTTIFGKR